MKSKVWMGHLWGNLPGDEVLKGKGYDLLISVGTAFHSDQNKPTSLRDWNRGNLGLATGARSGGPADGAESLTCEVCTNS